MRPLRFMLLLTLLLPLKSCEVPDVHPFAEATKDMATTLESSFNQVSNDLNSVSVTGMTAANSQLLEDNQKKLKEAADAFSKVAHGFDTYAEALNEAAAAGARKDSAVKKVNQALQQLATYVPVYGKAVGLTGNVLAQLAQDITRGHTIKKLADLASPEQDTYLQKTADYLRQATKKFAAIEAQTQSLLQRHAQTSQAKTWQDLYNSSLHRQQRATEMLSLLVEGEYYALTGDMSAFEVKMNKIIKSDLDGRRSIATVWEDKNSRHRASPKLLDALRQREQFYQELATINPQALASQAAQQSTHSSFAAQLGKAGAVLTTWASTHHKLRESLAAAKKITGKQVETYAKAVQDLKQEIDSVKKAQK